MGGPYPGGPRTMYFADDSDSDLEEPPVTWIGISPLDAELANQLTELALDPFVEEQSSEGETTDDSSAEDQPKPEVKCLKPCPTASSYSWILYSSECEDAGWYFNYFSKKQCKEEVCPIKQRGHGIHPTANLYLDPCLQCYKFCNCDMDQPYPDIRVNTLDNENIVVSSIVVRGSMTLQRLLERRMEDEQKSEPAKTATWFEDILAFPQNEVLDLVDETKAHIGATTEQWRFIEKFMGLHLDQVDVNTYCKRRARAWFRASKYDVPPPFDPVKNANYWACYDWEEDLFGNMKPKEFQDLLKVKWDLDIYDLHFVMNKWLHLFMGRPADVEDFQEKLCHIEDNYVEAKQACRGQNDKEQDSHWAKHFFDTKGKIIYGYGITDHDKAWSNREDSRSARGPWRRRIWRGPYPSIHLRKFRGHWQQSNGC